jgi:hypothetical protein
LKGGVATVGGEENRGRWRSYRCSVGAEDRKTERGRSGEENDGEEGGLSGVLYLRKYKLMHLEHWE